MHFDEFERIVNTIAAPSSGNNLRRDLYINLLNQIWSRSVDLTGAGHVYDVPQHVENAFLAAHKICMQTDNQLELVAIAEWLSDHIINDRWFDGRSIVYPLFVDGIISLPFRAISNKQKTSRTCIGLAMMAKFCCSYHLTISYEVALDPTGTEYIDNDDDLTERALELMATEKECISNMIAEVIGQFPWSCLHNVDFAKFVDDAIDDA